MEFFFSHIRPFFKKSVYFAAKKYYNHYIMHKSRINLFPPRAVRHFFEVRTDAFFQHL